MLPILCSVILSSILVVPTSAQMGYLGNAYESFSPCPDQVLNMAREIGGPPKSENYWDGTLYFDKWPHIREARVSLTLDQAAKIEIKPEDGVVNVINGTFHMNFYKTPPEFNKVNFKIRGRPYGKFPNVAKVVLNDENICPKPEKWTPALLGLANTGDTEKDFDGNDFWSNLLGKTSCGVRKIKHQGLITNGYETQPGDYPWHVALFHRERISQSYKCGGTLINPTTIVTAGHCVFDKSGRKIAAERVVVKLGRHHLYSAESHAQEYQAFKIILHPEYSESTLENDIALIRLATPVEYTDHIQPICLWNPKNNEPLTESRGTVMGWGYTEKDEVSDVLREAKMPVVGFAECFQSNRQFFGHFLTDKSFCAGFRNGTSVCNGDSGGGMIFEENNVWTLRGVVSLSMKRDDKDLCNTSHYVLFTDIITYLDWIEYEGRN